MNQLRGRGRYRAGLRSPRQTWKSWDLNRGSLGLACTLHQQPGLSKAPGSPPVSTEEDHFQNGLRWIRGVKQYLLHSELGDESSGFTDDAKRLTLDLTLHGFQMGYFNQRWGYLERITKNKGIVLCFICLYSVVTHDHTFVLLSGR